MLAFGLTQSHAVRVSTVEAKSPAARAGLREGDLIVGLDGVDDRFGRSLCTRPWTQAASHHDCVLKVLRGNATGQPIYFTVRPGEAGA